MFLIRPSIVAAAFSVIGLPLLVSADRQGYAPSGGGGNRYATPVEDDDEGPPPSSLASYELGDPSVTIRDTSPTIKGEISFPSPADASSLNFLYDSAYYDMDGVNEPTACEQGRFVANDHPGNSGVTSTSTPTNYFDLDGVHWNSEKKMAVICVQMWSDLGGEKIDQVETMVTIERTFTGQLPWGQLEVQGRSKDVYVREKFNVNQLHVKSYLCDIHDNEITSDPEVTFVAGQAFKVCVEYNDDKAESGDDKDYVVTALKNVMCCNDLICDALVDEHGDKVGLTELSDPGMDVMSFTGVIKFSYITDGDIGGGSGILFCSGKVDLDVASRRSLEETRALEGVGSSTFSLGIKLNPTESSGAATKGMTWMLLLMTAAIAMI